MHFTFFVVIDSGYHSLEKTLMIAYQLCWEIVESDLGLWRHDKRYKNSCLLV